MKRASFIATEPELEGLKERWRARAGMDADRMLDEEEKQDLEPAKLGPGRLLQPSKVLGVKKRHKCQNSP